MARNIFYPEFYPLENIIPFLTVSLQRTNFTFGLIQLEGILFLEVKNLFLYCVKEENFFMVLFIFNGFFLLFILIVEINDINFGIIMQIIGIMDSFVD